jgi:hypothetical protein
MTLGQMLRIQILFDRGETLNFCGALRVFGEYLVRSVAT